MCKYFFAKAFQFSRQLDKRFYCVCQQLHLFLLYSSAPFLERIWKLKKKKSFCVLMFWIQLGQVLSLSFMFSPVCTTSLHQSLHSFLCLYFSVSSPSILSCLSQMESFYFSQDVLTADRLEKSFVVPRGEKPSHWKNEALLVKIKNIFQKCRYVVSHCATFFFML